jgi:hypothetical protein
MSRTNTYNLYPGHQNQSDPDTGEGINLSIKTVFTRKIHTKVSGASH